MSVCKSVSRVSGTSNFFQIQVIYKKRADAGNVVSSVDVQVVVNKG